MPKPNRYFFDSDVLIRAKNDTYRPEFCAAFWDWIIAGHAAGVFYSLDKVKKEIFDGEKTDPLLSWAQNPALSEFFLNSKPATPQWTKLSAWATDPSRSYFEAAKAKFLNIESADAWLIAYAMYDDNYIIITNEVPAPDSKRDIKLPDAASAMGIQTEKLPSVLTKHAYNNFIFKI